MSKSRGVPPGPFASRIEAVRTELSRRKADGYLVQDRFDQIWLTGFTGEDGLVLVTPRDVVLLTDSRFDEAAEAEAPWASRVLRQKRGPEATAKALKRARLKRVAFNPQHMSVAVFADLQKLARPAHVVAAGGVISSLRVRKDADEVRRIRNAIRIAERAYNDLRAWLRPGMTERQVAARLVYEMQVLGAQAGAFPPIVAVGANASMPHYESGDAVVNAREPVLIDWGARAGWYVSDLTRTLALGSIAPELSAVHAIVREAHNRAIAAVRPGVRASAVDKVARDHIAHAGYGERFQHGLGHGIGLNVHEAPSVRRQVPDRLEPGMVITIEPGIYLPGVGGVRIEDDVLVTETGYEILSSLPTELR
ncbi:MAG: M24 family metallopeptidase [Phycisphaerae bacterium]